MAFHTFDQWTKPKLVVGLIGVRSLINIGLVGLTTSLLGFPHPLTITVGALFGVSLLCMGGVLVIGINSVLLSNADFLAQLVILGSVLLSAFLGSLHYVPHSVITWLVALLGCAAAFGVTFLFFPLYGEATVAP